MREGILMEISGEGKEFSGEAPFPFKSSPILGEPKYL